MSALGIDFVKYGNLEVKQDFLIIKYTKPKEQTIKYFEDKIEIYQNNNINTYNFDKYPKAQYMGLILRAIVNDNYALVNNLFKVIKKNKNISLLAKPIVSDYILDIQVSKNKKDTIIINMTNKDKITIETYN
jgi:hypothetical protein